MESVKVFKQQIVIPTYETEKPCVHPMFPEKKFYHGTSGRVYPHPVTEGLTGEKRDKEYTAIYIENEYLSIMVMPELGGKIYRIFDKTDGYDAVYYNEVIKPALVGLSGPWTAGGIEFSWPQHHRPSHFDHVDYVIYRNDDGSVTVWCGEIENMNHTKGMAGYTLYPGKAYLEIKGQLYNPTEIPQTFLWWANPAVPANEHTKLIFPPDVQAVTDFGKRTVSKFPIATGVYYGVDYGEGVDISRYKNIPDPTSYMAITSNFDFIANYDFEAEAGLLHIADHHIAPGKKQWTAGNGDYGRVWTQNITDSGKPYVELMAGVYSDNQTDFTFIMPYEEKKFNQYFMPYKKLGEVKQATKDVAVNLEVENGSARIRVYTTSEMKLSILLGGKTVASYMRETVVLSPYDIYDKTIALKEGETPEGIRLSVRNSQGHVILAYTPMPRAHGKLPQPAPTVKHAKEISSMEELYLAAVHLEQYRHPTRRAEDYYLEGLRRDPDDIRLNNGYGKLLYRKGLFDEAEKHFRRAIARATVYNNNPYDCEPYYNLGLTLKMQQRYDEAYDAFYKAVWDGKLQGKGFYQLACVSAKQNDFTQATEFIEQSITHGTHNMKARTLKSALMRHNGETEAAIDFTKRSIVIDPLDFGARYELFLLTRDFDRLDELKGMMRNSLQNYIDLSICYAEANLYTDASNVLALISGENMPMLHYYRAYYSNSDIELEVAQRSNRDYAFPNRLQSIPVLNHAISRSPDDWFAHYALGNLYYDKGVWFKAIKCWKDALECDKHNSGVLRNLAVAAYNKLEDKDEALRLMERAFMYAPEDARIFLELDMLRKKTNCPVKKRLKEMTDNMELTESRNDLYLSYITLLNDEQYFEYALRELKRHTFCLDESMAPRLIDQYRRAHIGAAKGCIIDKDYEGAITQLEAALTYPENLAAGKLTTSLDSDIYCMLGKAYESVDKITSIQYYKKAAEGVPVLGGDNFLSDIMPELFYYRAVAYGALGDTKRMKGGFNRLIDYSEAHIDDEPQQEYFEKTVPESYVFDEDLKRENYINCCYMAALGYYGLGNKPESDAFIEKGLAADCSHQGLLILANMENKPKTLNREDTTLMRAAKWKTAAK